MIAGGSTIYCFDLERPSQVLPVKIDSFLGAGERSDLLGYEPDQGILKSAAIELIQLVSNEGEIVEVELEGRIKLRLPSTSLVMTKFGLKLADSLSPPMEVLGIPRGTALYEQFLFVYPKPSLYRVMSSAKPAGVERMFQVTLPVPCCVIDGMIVKAAEID